MIEDMGMMIEIIIRMKEAMVQMIDRDLRIDIMMTIVMVVERMIDTMMITMVMIEIILLR